MEFTKDQIEELIESKLKPIKKDIQHIKKSLSMIVSVMEKSNRKHNLMKLIDTNKN